MLKSIGMRKSLELITFKGKNSISLLIGNPGNDIFS